MRKLIQFPKPFSFTDYIQGILIMSGLKKNNIINAVKIMISKGNKKHISNYLINDYKNKFVSKQIIKIIHSYIDYVNTYIWHK